MATGTDSEAYAKTQRIRLQHNVFFRELIRQVRESEPFRASERVLDVACGQQAYFEALWSDFPHIEVVGIDNDKKVKDSFATPSTNRTLLNRDYYSADYEYKPFDIVHGSFALTWLAGPGAKGTGKPTRLKEFFARARTLLKDEGWLLLHHPGVEDYFPDFNKLILYCLSEPNEDAAKSLTRAQYFDERRERVACSSIGDLKKAARQADFHVHLLANSLEWIPLSRDEYLAYWESGGKVPFSTLINSRCGSYDVFVDRFRACLSNPELLRKLGIRSFSLEGQDYFLLPVWHQYFIAQKAVSQSRPLLTLPSGGVIDSSLRAHAAARFNQADAAAEVGRQPYDSLVAKGKDIIASLYSDSIGRIAYLSLVDALGARPGLMGLWIDDEFRDRGKGRWIEAGRELIPKVRTFTQCLGERPKDSGSPIAIIGMTVDSTKEVAHLLRDAQAMPHEDTVSLRYFFCWQEGTLDSDKARQTDNPDGRTLGTFLIQPKSDDWPRLFAVSDVGVDTLIRFAVGTVGEPSSFIEPLRYFDWQTRVSAPQRNSFLIATTLVRGASEEPEMLPSLFAMIARKDPICRNAMPLLLQDAFALQALLALGTSVMSKRMVEALAKAERKSSELGRSHQMLLKLQRPLDALTNAFNQVQAEAHEMQAILNDPGESIFLAHKVLAPLFHEGHPIQISNYLSLTPSHDWDVDSMGMEDLQAGYCYALACIFGVQNRLRDAQTHAAFVQLAYTALKEKRESVVNTKLIELLAMLCGFCKLRDKEIEASVHKGWITGSKGTASAETDLDAAKRFSDAMKMLKNVAFTPFKPFGQEWPTAAVQVAATTKNVASGAVSASTEAPSLEHTPFSQNAILSFIIGVKSELRAELKRSDRGHERAISQVFAKTSGTILSEYQFRLARHFFGTHEEDSNPEGSKLLLESALLQDCIRRTIRYGIVGKTIGSFHGVFQDLLRHGLELATADKYLKDSWVHLEPPKPTRDHAVLLALGRATADSRFAGHESNIETSLESATLMGHYFSIVQERTTSDKPTGGRYQYWLRIIWSSDHLTVITPSCVNNSSSYSDAPQAKVDGALAAHILEPQAAHDLRREPRVLSEEDDPGSGVWPPIVCIDHDGMWFKAFGSLSFLSTRVTRHPFDDVSGFPQVGACVVILHGRLPNESRSARLWEAKLRELLGNGTVRRVIVVSAGGDPSEKGIAESDGFFWGVDNGRAIHPRDLRTKGSAKRSRLLAIIKGNP